MPKHPLKRAALMNDPRMASRRKQLMEGAQPGLLLTQDGLETHAREISFIICLINQLLSIRRLRGSPPEGPTRGGDQWWRPVVELLPSKPSI